MCVDIQLCLKKKETSVNKMCGNIFVRLAAVETVVDECVFVINYRVKINIVKKRKIWCSLFECLYLVVGLFYVVNFQFVGCN